MATSSSDADASETLPIIHYGNDYDSSFDSESEQTCTSRLNPPDKSLKKQEKHSGVALPSRNVLEQERSKEEIRKNRAVGRDIICLSVYERHKRLINDYILCYPGQTALLQRDTSKDKTDIDIIRENHQFLWDEDTTVESISSWEKRLAKRYYDKLFKEYCICDLRYYKEGKVAMRWRTQNEVVSGIGQFTCGEKSCRKPEKLRSWEVNFGYYEHGVKKNALVKVRLCSDCSYKLNFRHQKKEIVKSKRKRHVKESASTTSETSKRSKKSRKDRDRSSDESSSEEEDSIVAATTSSDTKLLTSPDQAKLVAESNSTTPDSIWKRKPESEKEEPTVEDEDDFKTFLDDLFL